MPSNQSNTPSPLGPDASAAPGEVGNEGRAHSPRRQASRRPQNEAVYWHRRNLAARRREQAATDPGPPSGGLELVNTIGREPGNAGHREGRRGFPDTTLSSVGPDITISADDLDVILGPVGPDTAHSVVDPATTPSFIDPNTIPSLSGPNTTSSVVGRDTIRMAVGRNTTLTAVGPDTTPSVVGRDTTLSHVGRNVTLTAVGRGITSSAIGPDSTPTVIAPNTTLSRSQRARRTNPGPARRLYTEVEQPDPSEPQMMHRPLVRRQGQNGTRYYTPSRGEDATIATFLRNNPLPTRGRSRSRRPTISETNASRRDVEEGGTVAPVAIPTEASGPAAAQQDGDSHPRPVGDVVLTNHIGHSPPASDSEEDWETVSPDDITNGVQSGVAVVTSENGSIGDSPAYGHAGTFAGIPQEALKFVISTTLKFIISATEPALLLSVEELWDHYDGASSPHPQDTGAVGQVRIKEVAIHDDITADTTVDEAGADRAGIDKAAVDKVVAKPQESASGSKEADVRPRESVVINKNIDINTHESAIVNTKIGTESQKPAPASKQSAVKPQEPAPTDKQAAAKTHQSANIDQNTDVKTHQPANINQKADVKSREPVPASKARTLTGVDKASPSRAAVKPQELTPVSKTNVPDVVGQPAQMKHSNSAREIDDAGAVDVIYERRSGHAPSTISDCTSSYPPVAFTYDIEKDPHIRIKFAQSKTPRDTHTYAAPWQTPMDGRSLRKGDAEAYHWREKVPNLFYGSPNLDDGPDVQRFTALVQEKSDCDVDPQDLAFQTPYVTRDTLRNPVDTVKMQDSRRKRLHIQLKKKSTDAETRSAMSHGPCPLAHLVRVPAFEPDLTCYLRPANESDLEAMQAMYNYEVNHGTQSRDVQEVTGESMTATLEMCRALSLPFIAVIAGLEHDVRGNKKLVAEGQTPEPERGTVLGFAFLCNYFHGFCGAGNSTGNSVVRLSIVVHRAHRRKFIAHALMDKLMHLVCPDYDYQEAAAFIDHDGSPAHRGPGFAPRQYRHIIAEAMVQQGDQRSLEGLQKMLGDRFGFARWTELNQSHEHQGALYNLVSWRREVRPVAPAAPAQ
ncbi:hypothetical protein GGTG_09422 [Gaeumannomyces tritici R3-111a-1]|uniref:Uncharacterized protein n=1 Tax=Gaeumannomyces tritici (strain R3-111a-1) TaxID=644352 RepID=J3P7C9_GAET3|nr:hypothetical protein GGTG_09422 [Gaeumannomyces tritici R3-111a-1]EJT72560.1 hypothetical protein GGTG_09422 [Gaeumannomyces tritici R3-111a-1]